MDHPSTGSGIPNCQRAQLSERRETSSVRLSVRVALSVGSTVAEVEFTEAMIAAAMAKADARVCVGSDRCYAFPHRLEDALASCTPKGPRNVGWAVTKGGR